MGVTIRIRRTSVIIEGYSKEFVSGWIPYYLTVYDNVHHKYEKDLTYSYMLPNGNVIMPRTVDISRLERKITSQGFEIDGVLDETEDCIKPRGFSKDITMKDHIKILNQVQDDSIRFLIDRSNHIHFRCLTLPTGSGKTVCAIAAMCYWCVKTLIVASQLSQQWIDELLDKCTVSYKKLYEISGIDSLNALLSNKYNPNSLDVFVASLQTLRNGVESGVYKRFCEKFGIGLVIVDEIHMATYTQMYVNMQADISETIFLTATPFRSDPAETSTFHKALEKLPRFGEDVNRFMTKYINAIWVFYDSKPSYIEQRKCQTWHGFSCIEFAKNTFNSQPRRLIIYDILKWAIDITLKSIDEDEKIAVIIELTQHVKMTVDWLSQEFPNVSVGDYSSNMNPNVKADSLKKKIIVSTDKSFGTGSDLKGKLRVLINTITFNSKVTATQMPGRLRNIPGKSVYYIDLVDKGYRRTWQHYQNRRKIIESYCKSTRVMNYGVDI